MFNNKKLINVFFVCMSSHYSITIALLSLVREMECSIKVNTGPFYLFRVACYNFKKYCISIFIIANSEDLDEMWHFIWVFTVCQSTHLGVSSLQRLRSYVIF